MQGTMPLSLEEFMMQIRDTSAETRIPEGKLDAFVNLVTQISRESKLASVARVCGIRSSNDHHTSVCHSSQQSGEDEHPEAYAANTYRRPPKQGVHDVARDTSAETIKLEGKLDALVNLVTQLVANRSSPLLQESRRIYSSNDHHTKEVTTKSRDQTLDRDNGSQLLAIQSARNNTIVIRGVHDVASYISAETRKLEAKLDALVNLFSARNDAIVIRGVHDVATDTSAETRKLEGKLDGLVNLVSQLATNQKSASVARVCGILSSNDHHTSVCPSSMKSGVDEHPKAYFSARNDAIVIRGVHDVATDTSAEIRKLEGKLDAVVNLFSSRNDAIIIRGVHDVATDTSAVTRKLEGKLNALMNLVTQLAENQKPASVARVSGIRSSNDHHTNVCHSSQQSGVDEHLEFSARNDAIFIRGVHDVASDTSAETRKLEAKLDALVNLVTQVAANQKPASVTRVCGIDSSNEHPTSIYTSSQESGVDEHPDAYAANTYSRPPQ
ncbi:hypothetical protein Fmac_032849 [Flemingia macrophylla]|uniref:Uncharacterized protein n=1 Tax=Flemingia macrophylla TaxID=520843 RepID=A0ABD1L631_9FABA